jgi:hypothetical protein
MTASVDDLVLRVKRLISLPQDDTLINAGDYRSFIDDCTLEKIFPRLMKIKDDYSLVRKIFNLQDSSGNGLYPTGVMPIPSRAWGNTLRAVKYIDQAGNYYKINPYFIEDEDLYQTRNLQFSSSFRRGFIPYNSGIKLVPPPFHDPGSIEMYFIVTPSKILQTTITGDAYLPLNNITYNSTTKVGTYTVSSILAGGVIDAVCGIGGQILFDIYNSQTGMLLNIDVPMLRTSNYVFTSTSVEQNGTLIIDPNITEITNFQFGGYPVSTPYTEDIYLVPAGYSPFTMLPPVLDNLLVYELAIKIMSAQGYVEELQIFMTEHADMRKDLLSQMAMRVETEPYVISNKRGIKANILYGGIRTRRGY